MPRKVRSKFTWNYNKRAVSRWLRTRLDRSTNSIDPFCMDEICQETDLSHQEVYTAINYWRRTSKYYWDEISKDTESVIRDWDVFVNNLNGTYEVYFLVSSYQKEFGRWIWYQPDFEDKETRDNRLIHNHIKGMFTRLDEMALMGEEVSATRLPAIEAVEALKAYDKKFLRNGSVSPATGTLLSERCRVYICPVCRTGKMHQLRGLDWQCRECRVTFSEDDFNDEIRGSKPE